jgi:heme-degrading monooxygenase HmoA
MMGVFVIFEGVDAERAARVAEKARATFEGMPGLRSKAFTVDKDAKRATNFYVWESEDAARAFFTDELRDRVTGLYGVAPRIEFVEIAELVDNGVS